MPDTSLRAIQLSTQRYLVPRLQVPTIPGGGCALFYRRSHEMTTVPCEVGASEGVLVSLGLRESADISQANLRKIAGMKRPVRMHNRLSMKRLQRMKALLTPPR
jgi:hypothetical protein